MNDDVIPLNKIGKIGTVKVYNQTYVDNQQKRIAELEKENTDLRDNYEQFKAIAEPEIERLQKKNAELRVKLDAIDKAGEHVRQQINNAFRNKPSYTELEKKNADLEKKLKLSEHNKKTVVHLSECISDIQDKKFTEAKEIIKGLLSCCRNYPQENAEKVKQAEQFLKEIENG